MEGDNFVIVEEPTDQLKQEPQEAEQPQQQKDFGNEAKKKNKVRNAKKYLAILLIVVLSAGTGYLGGVAAVSYRLGDTPAGTQNQVTIDTNGEVDTAEAVAAKVIPSVVGISTKTQVVQQNIFGMTSNGVSEGVGTGIIVDSNGYIITNSHVVSDGQAETITVQLSDGRELSGKVLWNDTTLDLAMVKVAATGLTAAELGDSDDVNIGSYAVAIGNPLGMNFERSVTQGIISGLNRKITVSDSNGETEMEGLLQTDASINAGNSGGPLLNNEGQVIGINSAKAASAEGLGFAIPINTAKPIIEEIIKNGTFEKAFIGISGANVELYLQYYPNEDLGTKTGVYISEVNEGSPANLAGIVAGDVITAIDGKKMDTMEALTRELFSYKPGDKVKLTIYRDGKSMEKEVKLGVSGE